MLSWRMSKCRLPCGIPSRRRMKPNVRHHQVSSQGLSANSRKMMGGVTLKRSEMTELTKNRNLHIQHALELWSMCARASWSPDFSAHTKPLGGQLHRKRRRIIGNDLLHINFLYLACKRATAPLPFWASLAEASCRAPDSWKTMPKYLKVAN